MKMKKMIYQEDRKLEILYDNKYLGYRYIILNLGTHPTAYIEIPKGHKLNGQDYDDIDLNVHGGLTYSRHELLGIDSENWYIGWDYAHCDDYAGYELNMPKELRTHSKKWTTEEIDKECKDAIQQIVDKYDNEVEEDKDIPLIPDDELYITANSRQDYNFKVLKEKINQVVKEFNEYRKENE